MTKVSEIGERERMTDRWRGRVNAVECLRYRWQRCRGDPRDQIDEHRSMRSAELSGGESFRQFARYFGRLGSQQLFELGDDRQRVAQR